MRTFIIAAVTTLLCLPAQAAGPHRVLEVDQTPVAREYAPGPSPLLDQPPNQGNGLFSDEGCAICGSGAQVIAENFTVSTAGAGFGLDQILFWGGYYSTDTPPAVDDFDVLIHEDNGGLPGTVVCSETGIIPTSRTATGVTLFGVSEYAITIDLATTCNLTDGTYWAELYNDTSGLDDDFFWETGNVDATAGITGSVWAAEAPGSTWTVDGTTDFAVQLYGTVLPVELQSLSIE